MLALEPEKDSYNPGDKVKVTADSNPSTITYKWVTTATNDTLGTEDTIDINDEMVGSQPLKVIVCNTMPIPKATSNCEERQFNVTVMSTSASAVIGVVLEILLCVTMAVIMCG
ncbi:hypothetical protein LSAT2_011258 [Lamellibrachia satsuma]|nr:hypothetical protein LSAT2_011258 [Lamellibrachia satsuma]